MKQEITLQKLLKICFKLIGPLFYAALIIFLIIYIQRLDWSVLAGIRISWLFVVVSTLIALASRYWGAFIWVVLLKNLGANKLRSQVRPLLYVYAKSWLGRYIPGTAPWILGKIYFASKLGVSKNKLAVSSLLEGGLQILVTLVISIVILLFDVRVAETISSELKLVMGLFLLIGIVTVIPPIFNRLFALVYKLVKRKIFPHEHYTTKKTILQGSSLYIIGSLLSGVSFFFITKAVYLPLEFTDLLFVLGISNLANAASMLAVFAPGGIGVREGIQVALLSLIMPIEVALLIAVVTRIWSVAVDLLFFATAHTMRYIGRGNKKAIIP